MAQVPTSNGPSVPESAAPTPNQSINPPEGAFGAAAAGAGFTALSKGAGQASEALASYANQAQAIVNKTVADQASYKNVVDYGQIRDEFMAKYKYADAALHLPEATAALNTATQKNIQGLSPLAQVEALEYSRRMQGYAANELNTYANTETKRFTKDTATSIQGQLISDTVANPDHFDANWASYLSQQAILDNQDGLPAAGPIAQQNLAVYKGKMVQDVALSLAATGHIEQANAFLTSHSAGMDGTLLRDTQSRLFAPTMSNDAANIAQQVVGGIRMGQGAATPAIPAPGGPVNARGLTAAMSTLETGILQAFPGTHATSEGRTPAQNAAAGGAPNSAHMIGDAVDFHVPTGMTGQQFAADIQAKFPDAKVLYEGPGAAHSTSPHVHVQLGTEGLASARPGASTVGNLTSYDLEAQRGAALVHTDALADAMHPGDATFKRQAEDATEGELNRHIGAAQGGETLTFNSATSAIQADPNIQSRADLFRAHPELAQSVPQLPHAMQDQIDGAWRRNAGDMTTPERQAGLSRYNAFYANRNVDPASYLTLNIPALDMPIKVTAQWMKEQQEFRAQGVQQTQQDTVFNKVLASTWVGSAMEKVGVNPNSTVPADRDKYRDFTGTLHANLIDFMQNSPGNRPPTEQEQRVLVARTIAQQTTVRPGMSIPLFGLNVPITPPSVQTGNTAFTIDPADRARAIKELGLGPNPPEQEIADWVATQYAIRRRIQGGR